MGGDITQVEVGGDRKGDEGTNVEGVERKSEKIKNEAWRGRKGVWHRKHINSICMVILFPPI